jgi:hypothetical protein
MNHDEKVQLIRRYAAGDITWSMLQARGFDSFVEVLGLLGELGLRQPIAPMDGPNVEARQHGRAFIREVLKAPS